MYRGRVRDYEWLLLFLSAGGGLLWGIVALLIGFSWLFIRATGVLRAILIVLALPFYLAFWTGRALQLQVIDPSGVVIAMGGSLGLIVAFGILVVLRWRER